MPSLSNPSPHPDQAPVIVMGMHRSGTSMVCDMLRQMGLFTGAWRDANSEAYFFMQLNDWALRSAGGSWEYPTPIRDLLAHRAVRALTVDYLRASTASPRAAAYLGRRLYLRYRSLHHLDFPWGWKDPRNGFTLPLWLEVFPQARVVRIVRHGVDVAKSCQVAYAPTASRLRRAATLYALRKPRYLWMAMRSPFARGLREATLDGSLSLWEEYCRQGNAVMAQLGDAGMEIRYEEFLACPERVLPRLAAFCGLGATPERVKDLARQVRPERAFAFRLDPELRAFAARAAGRLAAYGYGPDGFADPELRRAAVCR